MVGSFRYYLRPAPTLYITSLRLGYMDDLSLNLDLEPVPIPNITALRLPTDPAVPVLRVLPAPILTPAKHLGYCPCESLQPGIPSKGSLTDYLHIAEKLAPDLYFPAVGYSFSEPSAPPPDCLTRQTPSLFRYLLSYTHVPTYAKLSMVPKTGISCMMSNGYGHSRLPFTPPSQ